MVLPKLKMVYETNPNDLKIVLNILACLEIILHRLEKQQIVEDVLPLLWIINQTDPEVIARIAGEYTMTVYTALNASLRLLTICNFER